MYKFKSEDADLRHFLNSKRKPDFDNFLKVLKGQRPSRPVLFEIFLNEPLYQILAQEKYKSTDRTEKLRVNIKAFTVAGFDYTTAYGCDIAFKTNREEKNGMSTISLNEGGIIFDEESFENYEWPDPDSYDYSLLTKASDYLPEGMKLMVMGPGGVLENVIALTGYENLCYMVKDNEPLAKAIFDRVGSILVRYYENCAPYETVGALMSNDDWGFKGQTMLSVDDMKKYVFDWHEKIVEKIHNHDKPAILHSCGDLSAVMDDVIDHMKFDAKHSFEDNITPVEDIYDMYSERIAILGGIDMDFLCRESIDRIYERSCKMLDRSRSKGGYALGSGNSVPEYVPHKNFYAMILAARNWE